MVAPRFAAPSLRLASASAAFLTQAARPQTASQTPAQPSAPQTRPAGLPRAAHGPGSKNRKNFFVGIQVRGFSWVDEGVDQVLDNLQKKGDVNTVWAYTFSYGEARLRKNGPSAAGPRQARRPPSPAARSTITIPSISRTPFVKDFRC